MKDSIRSLKVSFIVIAVLNFFASTSTLSHSLSRNSPLQLIIALAGFSFSAVYFFISIALRKLLIESPEVIRNCITASIIYITSLFLTTFLGAFFINASSAFVVGLILGSTVQLVIGLLICQYMLNTVNRLSQEEKDKKRLEYEEIIAKHSSRN
jgi:hypothetical protein